MADYRELATLLDTTQGMTALVNNEGHDDDTLVMPGVDWFRYDGVAANEIYMSGNSFFGFSGNREELKVCRRDCKLWHLYRQEGTLFGTLHFLKLRWQGYAHYSQTSEEFALQYELFLFEDGRMFLNAIKTAVSSVYLGTSALVCGASTLPLTVATRENCPVYYTFTPADETGRSWTAEPELIVVEPPYDVRYLVRADGRYYAVDKSGALTGMERGAGGLAAFFMENGSVEPPRGALLLPLCNPELLCWVSEADRVRRLAAVVTGTPPPQTLASVLDVSNPCIVGFTGMTAVYEGKITVSASTDRGVNWSEPQPLAEFMDGDVHALWRSVEETKELQLRFVLYGDATLTRFRLNYEN